MINMKKANELTNETDYTIDGRSKKKAYTLIESGLLDSMEPGTVKCLQQIHAYLFGGLYDFAGQIRTKTIWKDGTLFCRAEYLMKNLSLIEAMPERTFDEIVNKPGGCCRRGLYPYARNHVEDALVTVMSYTRYNRQREISHVLCQFEGVET